MIIVQASEPSGEGAAYCNVVGIIDDDGIDDIGNHVVLFVQIPKFWSDLGAGDDFLDPSRVEYIDKRLIFDLEIAPNR